ncbi:MAG TPA: amidohydrolase family protein [Acidimicrobiales bacterium]|nr:amidohydrolase family protein [Acidimicrobiales bacterium]
MHDLVIRGGTVVDGSGGARRRADVAVDGDRIGAVGKVTEQGRREIDADGALVTPGWVDIHTHYDGQVTWDPEVSPSGWHGVTTVVMGNCGVGFAPARPGDRDWLIQLMEGVEDIPGTALAEGMSWNWESFPDYLDEVDSMARILDVAALLPHGALRAYVLGEGRANDEATTAEREEMRDLAGAAVAAGAVGISTTRTMLHRAKDGELAAGTTAAAEELVTLGDALAGQGRRVFSVASDMIDTPAEIAWMAEISKRSRVPVTFQTLQADFAPDWWREWIGQAMAANRDGAWLVPQVAGKPASVLVGFESSYHPFIRHGAYRRIARLPVDERVVALKSPEVRDAILAEEIELTGPESLLWGNLHKLFPLGDPPDYEPDPATSVAAVAEREGRKPLEVAYDMMLERDGRALLYLPILGYAGGGLSAIHEMLQHPGTVLGLGDGGAHCGVLCDASLPTFMLTHWTRDRTRGERLALEAVVAHQSRRTAALYGFEDRGLLAPGMLADVNVIDYEGLALDAPETVYDLPAGGRRLIQRGRGYVATVKSGVVVRTDDESTGERPGRLLRGPQPALA